MLDDLNWDDVPFFLTTLRATSLRQAAGTLGVSRPTVARRLTALEERLGLRLFDRRPDGLHPTAEAMGLLPAAEEAERAMLGVARAAQTVDRELRGPIRVTVPSIVAAELLMQTFVDFCRQWPLIDLHLSGSYSLADLARRESDVAIRFVRHGVSPDDRLHGRKVGTAYSAEYGDGDCWIGQMGPERDKAWVALTSAPELPSRGAIYDGELQRAACQAGLGRAFLPCFFADGYLPRRSEPVPSLDVWVLVHPDLRRNPRLRVFRDAVVASLAAQTDRLQGRVSREAGSV